MTLKNKHRFYIYKVTCPKSGKFYIGMHSTRISEELDTYEGSGVWPRDYRKKYGKGILLKSILLKCENYNEVAAAERSIVNEKLLLDPLCMNMHIGGIGFDPVLASKVNKGRTCENSQGRRDMVAKLTGRTKDQYEYLRQIGIKNSKHHMGKTKETDIGVRKMAETMSKRNKENCQGIRNQVQKISGRTKETNASVRAQSLKIRKITEEQDIQIYLWRLWGLKIVDIKKTYYREVPYQSLVTSANRGKKLIEGDLKK